MDAKDYSLAVWKDCERCAGVGHYEVTVAMKLRRQECAKCFGHGKLPTFIPLEKIILVIDRQGVFKIERSPETVTAIQQWLEKQEV